MRFVAQHGGFVVGVRPERRRLSVDGETIVTRHGIEARFRPGFNQHDLAVAMGAFQFQGLYQHEDEATPVDPAYRIAVYDTDEEYERSQETEYPWTLEDKELVEQKLLSARTLGEAFVVVPEEKMDPPWPLYRDFDGDTTELVLTAVNVIGVRLEDVLAYEQSKWGENREDVIDALQTAIQIRDEGKVIVG
jgi:hypothetical protein